MSQPHSDKPPVFCLMGPTASGKTNIAVEAVQRRPLEIISVDSAQVYCGMDIGSGKPDAATLASAPHRLIDIRDPAEAYSAADFRRDALREIHDVIRSGKQPLLVGGTMLYFRVLRDGLASMPDADPVVRARISQMAQQQGWSAVHQKLAEVDPESARRIHPNDPQRLQRALEIYLVSGQSMTALHRAKAQTDAAGADSEFSLHFLAIQPQDRGVLHNRIAERFRAMLQQGLVEEVAALYQRGDLGSELPSIRSVGYRQVWRYLAGELNYDDMVEKGIIATRQLAKRQFTWLRSWSELHVLDTECIENKKSLDSLLKIVDTVSI